MKNLKKLLNPDVLIEEIALLFLLIYACLGFFCYIWITENRMNSAYKSISQMELGAIEEDEEEELRSYHMENMEIIICDEEMNAIFVTRTYEGEEQIRKIVAEHKDDYLENAKAYLSKGRKNGLIRIRGRVKQDGKQYYVHIRKEIVSAKEMVEYTLQYFLLMVLVLCFVMNRKRKKARQVQQEVEKRASVYSEELITAQKDFVANVSHELKTPLAIIAGQIEMLQYAGEAIDREYYYSSIKEEVGKMSDMVGSLLDLTIMEHQMESMEMSSVNITEMIEYLVLKYDALVKKNQWKLQVQIEKDCICIGNRMYLEQAVNNYLMNAFERTAQGKRIALTLRTEAKEIFISVYNEGQGVPKEKLKEIWQGYHRVKMAETANTDTKNAGLGLYMVSQIIRQHNGSYGVENKRDGVEFWIRIPK